MSGSRQPMTRASSHRLIGGALRAALSTLSLLAFITASRAQEPPLDVGGDGRLAASPGTAYALDQWLFYPGLTASTTYSDNLFNSSIAPISALGFELSPSLTAEWTNGIHTTTLNANFDHTTYPTDTDLNTFNWGGSFTQKYAPLRDLTFSLNGNYAHQTLSNSLQNSIPTPVNAPQTTILPDGNTLLPNGVILSPLGVPIGQATPTLAISNGTTLINPNDQFTGTLSIDKIFNHGILSLNGSLAQTDYETNGSQDSTSKSFVGACRSLAGPIILCLFGRLNRHDFNLHHWTLHVIPAHRRHRYSANRIDPRLGLLRASGILGIRDLRRRRVWGTSDVLSDAGLDAQRFHR